MEPIKPTFSRDPYCYNSKFLGRLGARVEGLGHAARLWDFGLKGSKIRVHGSL